MGKRRLLAVALAAFLVVGLALAAGCGGSETATTQASTASTAETVGSTDTTAVEAASGQTIPIGVELGFTGDMAPWAEPIANAAVVAVEEINAAGGVLGRPLELFTGDDESGVEGGVRAAQKLVNVNKVVSIVGPESNPIMALLDFAKENQVPIISTSAGTSGLDKVGGQGNFIYRTNASDSFIGVSEAWIAKNELGANEVIVIMESTEGATSAGESFMRNFEAIGGTITDKVTVNPGQAKYSSELKAVYDQNPSFVYMSASQPVAIAILKERYEKGYGGQIMGSSEIQTPETVEGAGPEAAAGLLTTRIVELTDSQGWDRFVKLYSDRWGEPPSPGYYQSNTYDAVVLAALAMEAAGEASGAAIDQYLTDVSRGTGSDSVKVWGFEEGKAELANGNSINFEGSSGPCDFNEYGNISGAANAVMQVDESGEWIVLKTILTSELPAG
ncbi:MAG: ABC transporter substrate-binding protein [Thermoleophilia bacterium]|nr:ABC transporter substrate-binding protein [Thermoleophilia bacterium]